MFFKNFKVWETELAGRKLTLETGKMAGLANASIMARYGTPSHVSFWRPDSPPKAPRLSL